MTRKIISLVIGYFALGIITFSACVTKYEAYICDIQFAGLYAAGNYASEDPDTFDEQIGFEITSIESSPTCYIPSLQVFNSAFATTKCAVFQNRLVASTYYLSLNRPIVLAGDTILSHTDLLNLPEISSLTEITIDEDCNFVISRILFKPELTGQMQFETGEYEVTFKCSTSDDRAFTKTRNVIFEE